MDLRQQVRDYYISHAAELPLDKQLHLASRLGSWLGDPAALLMLRALRRQYVPQPCSETSLRQSLQAVIDTPVKNLNAAATRQAYFAKYPHLFGLHLAVFRVRHLQYIYGVDARHSFFALWPKEKCQQLERQLLSDHEAIRQLSTYVVNYIYLLERILLGHKNTLTIDVERFYHIADHYNIHDQTGVQLFIYLYTHCIIGETNFYQRRIPAKMATAYRHMLTRLERLITDHFKDINLDSKLEFLVCCRICDFNSSLFAPIEAECARSVSREGTFLIDRHNTRPQPDRQTFAASEHRNVLFIMSGTQFVPHSTLV